MRKPMRDTAQYMVVTCLLVGLCVSGCSTTGAPRTKTILGGAGGAAAGGLLAAVFGGGATGIAAGTILGGLIGGAIGDRLDEADYRYAAQSTQSALEYAPVNQPVAWRNPDSGHHGQVVATRTYRPNGATEQYCREYQHTVFLGGREETVYGHACRQPDGTWQVQN